MKPMVVIDEIRMREKKSMYRLSYDMGYRSKNTVRNMLSRDYGMSVDSLIRLCDELGADVVIRYKESEYVLGE